MSKSAHPWVRLYKASLHNPKIVTLSDRQHRAWHNCMLIADDETGNLPSLRDMAVHLRTTPSEADQLLSEMVEAGLVDAIVTPTGIRGYRMHDWSEHQYKSDSSAERTRRYRAKNGDPVTDGDRHGDGSETSQRRPQSPDPESDTDTNYSPPPVEQAAARVPRGMEQVYNILPSGRGRTGRKQKNTMPDLIARAEGFGLDATVMEAQTRANSKSSPEGYFRTLCINALVDRCIGVSEAVATAAIDGDQDAAKAIYAGMSTA